MDDFVRRETILIENMKSDFTIIWGHVKTSLTVVNLEHRYLKPMDV